LDGLPLPPPLDAGEKKFGVRCLVLLLLGN
jgi:hypothetical protein